MCSGGNGVVYRDVSMQMQTQEAAELATQLRAHPLLSTLDAEALKRTVKHSKLVRFRPERRVLSEGDPPAQVFCLLSGSVRVFHRHQNKEVLLKLFRAPALFGE